MKKYILLFFLVYGYIFSVMLNYENAWMNNEIVRSTEKVLKEYKTVPDRVLQVFNWPLLEGTFQVRLGSRARFVTHFFYVLNILLRNWLFQYIPPHPSLSLTWILALVLTPYFLYKLFFNLTQDREVALWVSLIYVTLPGCLVPIMMLFHPAKALANFFYAFCLYLASRINQKLENNNPRFFKLDFFILAAVMFIAFFADEYCLFIFLLIPVFFYRIFWGPSKIYAFALYLFLPFLYYASVVYALPAIYSALGYPGFNIFTYLNMDRQNPKFFFDWFYALVNFVLLMYDNLVAGFNVYLKDNSQSLKIVEFLTTNNHVQNPENIRIGWHFLNDKYVPVMQAIHNFVVGIALILFIPALGTVVARLKEIKPAGYLLKSVLALALFTMFFTFIHVTNNVFSGCGWYGSSFSVLFAIVLGFLFYIFKKGLRHGRLLIFVLGISLAANALWNTRLVNYAWLSLHYKENYWQLDVWFNKISRYEIYQKHYIPKKKNNFELTYKAWRNRYNPPVALYFVDQAPIDVRFYLRAELPFLSTEGL